MQTQPAAKPLPFFLETRPNEPHPSLKEARCAAGRDQQVNGIRRSIRILQGGEVVDLKRF
jgi:hypothetical protein